MSKFIKFILIAGALFLVLVAGAWITIKQMFPPEKIRRMVTAEISKTLGREARLGAIQVGILRGIQIEGFALSEYPDFNSGTFVQAKNFVLKFSFWPLLKRKVVIDQALLESPEIRIVQNADGKTFNFSNLLSTGAHAAAAARGEPSTASPGTPISLTISKAVLSNGKIEFIDKSPRKIKLVLNPINLSVAGGEIMKPMSLDLSAKAGGNYRGKNLEGGLTLKCVVDPMAQSVNIQNLEARLDELTLGLQGKLKGFFKPSLDLSLSIRDINFKSLSKWVSLPPQLSVSGSPSLSLGLNGPLDSLDCTLNADFTKTEIGYSGVFRKESQIPASLAFTGYVKNQDNVEINKLALKISGFEADVKGSVRNIQSSDPAINVEIGIGLFEVKDLAPHLTAAKGSEASGRISLQAKAEGTKNFLTFSGGLSLEALKAKVGDYGLDGISGSIRFTQNEVEIPRLAGKLGIQGKGSVGFDLQASGRNLSRQEPDITLNAKLDTLDLGMFQSDKKEAPAKGKVGGAEPPKRQTPYHGPAIKTQGTLKIAKVVYSKFDGQNAEAVWKITGLTPALDKLSGTAQVQMANGKINKIPLLVAIAPILHTDPSALVYSRMGGHIEITRGTARTEDFQVNSQAADLFAKGTIYLPTDVPDLLLTAKLPKGSLGGTLGDFSNDSEGRPTFAFKLKGNWNPAFDSSQVQKKATEELKKKAAETLETEGKKLLEQIFKR